MMKISRLLLVIGLLFAGAVNAQVYNRFGPANGVLKGDTSTYQTTAAVSLDIRGLWSGTCDGTSFLRGDGVCVAVTTQPPGNNGEVLFNDSGVFGADTGLSFNSATNVLTVTGGLVSDSLTAASNLLLASPSGSVTLRANGTNWLAIDNAGTFLINTAAGTNGQVLTTGGPGSPPSWTTVGGGGAVGANPTATIGLSAVNGAAGTFLRSDGAPALSQAIVPTWTGAHTFTASPGFIVSASSGDNVTRFFATGAGTDAKNTLVRTTTSGNFAISRATDASPLGIAENAFILTRNGSGAFSAITLGNVTDNPSFTFSGSGTITSNGSLVPNVATAPTWTAQHTFSPGTAVAPAIFNAPATITTALRGNNNGTDDVEMLLNTTSAGDSYVRTTNLSGTNWSFGNRRASSNFVIANGVGLATPVASLSTAGTWTATTFSGAHTGDGSGLTSLDAGDISAGTLPVARGGTGVTSSTGTGSTVLSASPTFTGTLTGATGAFTTLTRGGSNVCTLNGTNCPVGRIQGAATTATSNVSCGSFGSYNPANTFTPNAAGDCTVNWTTPYSAGPICTATPTVAANQASIIAVTTTSARVNIANNSGTLVAGSAYVVCFGL